MTVFKIEYPILVSLLWAAPGFSQLTYPGCSNLAASDFTITELAKGDNTAWSEPVGFDVQGVYNAAGDSVTQVNLFFVERSTGKVKFYDGATGTVSLAGMVPTYGGQDNGLMGVAVDPHFNTNRYLYLWGSPPLPNKSMNRRMRLSRFTVKADNTLDMASQKIMIDILESKTDTWHCGGPMQFDSYGDLWLAIGNNSMDADPAGDQIGSTDSSASAAWSSSNTASLRGGFIRIHPDSSTAVRTLPSGTYGPGYSIPAGNFGEYWADQFQSQGNAALAAQYRDPNKVLPEVYVKGERSNYSIAVHPTKRWLAWGTVNYNSDADEYNIVTHPAFTGYPYWEANNRKTPWPTGFTNDVNAPTNTSPLNSGVTQLPPATPAAISCCTPINNNVAIGGPIYAYNRNLKNPGKLPPHFDQHWFNMVFSSNNLYVTTLDTAAVTVVGSPLQLNGTGKLWAGIPLRGPVNGKIGPDGALYILNYDGFYSTNHPSVARVTYKGSCILPPLTTAVDEHVDGSVPRVVLTSTGMRVQERGAYELSLFGNDGRRLLALNGSGEKTYEYSDLRNRFKLKTGVYIAQVKSERGLFRRVISLL